MATPHDPDQPAYAPLRAWLEETVGALRSVRDASRPFGRKSVLWAVEAADGTSMFLKQHEEHRLYERARNAYTGWLRHWTPPEGCHVPGLRAHSDALGVLLIDALPGRLIDPRPAGAMDWDVDTLVEVHARAGAFAGALQRLPLGDTPDAGALLEVRVQEYLDFCESHIEPEQFRWARRHLLSGALFQPSPAVACHMDFTPRNWVVHAQDGVLQLGVIDWERARPDHRLQVIQRLDQRYWGEAPALRDAFLAALGWAPTDEEQHCVELLRLLDCVAGIAWAREHDDRHFEGLLQRHLVALRERLG